MRLALALVALAACDPVWDPSDFPEAPVRAVPPSGMESLWQAEVEQAILMWEVAVEPYGCRPPFRIADRWEDAYPITLVEDRDWNADFASAVGLCWRDSIEIRLHEDHPVRAATLVHELGHAMGLEHHDDASWGNSIMYHKADPRHIEDRDARAAACQLGCGPCDTIEEYDQGF